MSQERIAELVELLEKASEAYYGGESVISDDAFDKAREELKQLDPDNAQLKKVGAPISAHGAKVQHKIPMGSLDNANNLDEYNKWHKKTVGTDEVMCSMHKLDGSSIEIVYSNGFIVQAITRGDGFEGEDVTQNIRRAKNVPTKLSQDWSGSVRGEVMLLKADWEEQFKGESNPRNSAAGTVRRSDGTNAEHLSFFAFNIGENGFEKHSEKLEFLQELGFDTVWYQLCTMDGVAQVHEVTATNRDTIPYEIDGMVIRINDEAKFKQLGIKDNRPRGARAFKFKAMEATTKLLDVELTIGHTGAIIPTAKMAPVAIGGVTVSSALLNNYEEIERLGIALNDEVKVIRAGDVIPKVVGVAQKAEDRVKIVVPTECPFCSSQLEKDGAHLFCRNDDCTAQNESKFKLWITKRNIKHIGDSLRQELFYNQGVTKPHQLYQLTEEKLAGMTRGGGVVGSLAGTIMTELDKSRTAKLAEFVGSLGIKFLGRRQAVHMIEQGLDTIEKFRKINVTDLCKLDGFSDSKAFAIVTGFEDASEEIDNLLKVVEIVEEEEAAPVGGELAGKSFVFTGKIERVDESGNRFTRQKMQELVRENGGVPSDRVSKGLTYLVQANPDSQSSKTKKAAKYGVEVLAEADFFKMMGM